MAVQTMKIIPRWFEIFIHAYVFSFPCYRVRQRHSFSTFTFIPVGSPHLMPHMVMFKRASSCWGSPDLDSPQACCLHSKNIPSRRVHICLTCSPILTLTCVPQAQFYLQKTERFVKPLNVSKDRSLLCVHWYVLVSRVRLSKACVYIVCLHAHTYMRLSVYIGVCIQCSW